MAREKTIQKKMEKDSKFMGRNEINRKRKDA